MNRWHKKLLVGRYYKIEQKDSDVAIVKLKRKQIVGKILTLSYQIWGNAPDGSKKDGLNLTRQVDIKSKSYKEWAECEITQLTTDEAMLLILNF